MSEVHEHMEHAEHIAGWSKKIALLIAVLALSLSFSETLGKSAQTEAVDANVKSSDTWAFYQAKDIRRTTLTTAADQTLAARGKHRPIRPPRPPSTSRSPPGARPPRATNRTRKPARAARNLRFTPRAEEKERDLALAKYHHYELASAAFQVGIVLASATVITGIVALAWFAGALGVAGILLLALGLFAPHAMTLL